MKAIIRSTGITPSEKYLAKLADRTFLNLWSYPNLFIDKKENSSGTGKELCDLLVVCGEDVIIFSDKSIAWPQVDDIGLAWSRWYRRAIEKSAAQIRGAERWLYQFPERIFLDAACTQRFPIELAPAGKRRVHGIIVALGAGQACAKHFPGSSGTFIVFPHLKGSEHTGLSDKIEPFSIGDVNPEGSFIHVFDDSALDVLMHELDTVSDFTSYLTKRERVIRDGKLAWAPGEEDLLGYYLTAMGANDEHDFVKPNGKSFKKGQEFIISEGTYAHLVRRPEYQAKRQADQISYVWDRLIEEFTNNVLAGTSVSVFGEAPTAAEAEKGLRTLAVEHQVYRRMMAEALLEAMERAEARKQDRFVRVIMPGKYAADRKVAYVFLILAYPAHLKLAGEYEQYRKVRTNMLHAYCLHVFSENRDLKRVVGIAFDASSKVTGRQGGSEDILALEIHEWNEEIERQATKLREEFDVMRPERLEHGAIATEEFPRAIQKISTERMSRQQRRALERSVRKQSER